MLMACCSSAMVLQCEINGIIGKNRTDIEVATEVYW